MLLFFFHCSLRFNFYCQCIILQTKWDTNKIKSITFQFFLQRKQLLVLINLKLNINDPLAARKATRKRFNKILKGRAGQPIDPSPWKWGLKKELCDEVTIRNLCSRDCLAWLWPPDAPCRERRVEEGFDTNIKPLIWPTFDTILYSVSAGQGGLTRNHWNTKGRGQRNLLHMNCT